MGLFENARRPATDPADHALALSLPPPPPQEKTSTSYPKTSPHQFSHHQCVDPRIDSLDSPHLESKCKGPLHNDSHPKPASDRVLTSSRARISSPLLVPQESHPSKQVGATFPHQAQSGRVFTRWVRVIRSLDPVRGLNPHRSLFPSTGVRKPVLKHFPQET
jgi:hypothetical protein